MEYKSISHSLTLKKFIETAKENDILVRYEELRQQIRQRSEENKEKLHWFLRFASGEQLREHLQRYLELQEAFNGSTMNEWRDAVLKQYPEEKETEEV